MNQQTQTIKSTLSKKLENKTIVLAITGSVAASQSPEIARQLIRHGAEVKTVMSKAAQKLIGPQLMHWATGNPVITKIDGETQHIELLGQHDKKADLMLIAPCTANTLSKIACGIDDTTVTTMATTAIGSKTPLIIAPAMHQSMYQQPFVQQNIEKLRQHGIRVITPQLKENKAKLATVQQIVQETIKTLEKQKTLSGKKILIASGATIEHIDPIRVITNLSSGKTGKHLAETCLQRGAQVDLIWGRGTQQPPRQANTTRVNTTLEMYSAVQKSLKEKKYDIVILCAAPADYTTEPEKQKIDTKKKPLLTLDLKLTPKITHAVKTIQPQTYFIGFKAEYGKTEKQLLERGKQKMTADKMDMIVVNDVKQKNAGFETDTNRATIILKNGKTTKTGLVSKKQLAETIIDTATQKTGAEK